MPSFPSRHWCEAYLAALLAEPGAEQAGRGLSGTVAIAVVAQPPRVPHSFAAWARLDDGRLEVFEVLEDPDEFDGLAVDFAVRAGFATWKGLLEGSLDPVEAVLRGRIEVHGGIEPLVARIQHRHLLKRALQRVPTTFADVGGETSP